MYIKTFEKFNFFKNTNSYISNLKINFICKKYKIRNYTINPDGSIDVDGNVDLEGEELTNIPIKFNEVSGYFHCNSNNLTTLEGCPKIVGGWFYCCSNNLKSLKGCPERVGSYFECSRNNLTTLEYAPKRVGGNFYCESNDIWTFEDFNTSIGGYFSCKDNPIYKIWKLFENTEKLELLNEIDAIRPGKVIIMDRLNEFLIMIGEEPVQNVKGYKCI